MRLSGCARDLSLEVAIAERASEEVVRESRKRLVGRAHTGQSATMKKPFLITGLAHIGLRVADLARSLEFYGAWGFELAAGPIGPEPVAILQHSSGLELNLILNAEPTSAPNVLMDIEVKHPGYTHVALTVSDVRAAQAHAENLGMTVSGGPVQYPGGACGLFLRDPDRNVVELFQPAPPAELSQGGLV